MFAVMMIFCGWVGFLLIGVAHAKLIHVFMYVGTLCFMFSHVSIVCCLAESLIFNFGINYTIHSNLLFFDVCLPYCFSCY